MAQLPETKQQADEKEIDIYRDTPVRFLGYANEVGEAFRTLVHKNVVHSSYGVASLYVLADTVDKSKKMYNANQDNPERTKKVMIAAGDTLVWQALASVIIPGFTINRVCAGSYFLMKRFKLAPKPARKWLTTAIGLACIPFIIHPIDNLVTVSMDMTIRKVLSSDPAEQSKSD
ncbi:mitochondrial fission process protein 1 [Neocloeon triangulifer]|uniref:mitochondrial fission process protein 1 n=1 Tax=Neocloeon triangulifer TaxID=2078957 RepID=UPI00286F2DC5|nr:mitochondrial fission process protein 1 [Neocloeon triangulifer]